MTPFLSGPHSSALPVLSEHTGPMQSALEHRLRALRGSLSAAQLELAAREAPLRRPVVVRELVVGRLREEAQALEERISACEAEIAGPGRTVLTQAPRLARICLAVAVCVAAVTAPGPQLTLAVGGGAVVILGVLWGLRE